MDLLLAGVLALAANADSSCKECKAFNSKVAVTKTVTRSKDRLKRIRAIIHRGK
jgi:hypothetical protein